MSWLKKLFTVLAALFKTKPEPEPIPEPPAGEPSGFDLAAVRWMHGFGSDIAHWPVTATIGSVSIRLPSICSAGISWPANWTKLGKKNVQACHVVIAKFGDTWYAGCWEALNLGVSACRPLEGLTKPLPVGHENWGPFCQVEKDPFITWHPQPGEKIGFMITSWIRSGVTQPVGRSEVVWTTWPEKGK